MLRGVLLLVVLLGAGCLGVAPGLEDASQPLPVEGVVAPFAQDHDHTDPTLHDFALGVERLGYHNLVPGGEGRDAAERGDWLNSEIIVRGSHAYVPYMGAPWLFAILDVADPLEPRLVGAFETSNAWGMDMAVSDDGDWVFVSIYPGVVGELMSPGYALGHLAPPNGPAVPGVAVVDARDRTNPTLSGFLPIHGLGPHTAAYHRYPDGTEVVFANKAEGGIPGNGIVVAEVVETPAGTRTLAPRSVFLLDSANDGDFPHDVDVQEHPLTGRTLLYAAYWDAGLVVVDVSDPAAPVLVSRTTDVPAGEEVQIHDAHPFPTLVAGRHYTLTAPEIITGDTSGHLRVWDTTDPSAPVHAGSWILPGAYVVDQPFSLSTHNFAFLPDGRIALAHGHAGLWILDWLGEGGVAAPDPARMAAPVAVAYFLPGTPGAVPPVWTPVHGSPWVWGAGIDDAGNVWVADVASGLHGLRVTA